MPHGLYARVSTRRPHDRDTVDFEAGYLTPRVAPAETRVW
jgi:hypothetical protein